MKFCAYIAICLSLPFALLAEDVDTDEPETSPEDEAAVTPAAQAEGFKRYKSILDRMPFGVPPPGFNPDAPGGSGTNSREETTEDAEVEAAEAEASEIEQQILSSITVSMLNRSPDGRIFVGFTDKSVQPPRNYLLMVGEKREGCEWMVADADPDSGEVKISKDGVEATLKMGGGGDSPSGEKAKEGGGAPRGAVARMPQRRPGMGPDRRHHRRWPQQAHSSGPAVEDGEGEKKKLSGLEIARARRQERINRQLAEEEKQREAAELAQKEHEEREREKKEREREREQEKRERELAAEERKAQMDQLLQLRDELRRQREEKQAERKDAGEPEEVTPQNDVQEANEG